MTFSIRQCWIKSNKNEYTLWKSLLHTANLRTEQLVDAVYIISEDGTDIGTGSIYQNIIKCVAITPDYQGGAAFNTLISHCTNEIYSQSYTSIYVYTKPASAAAFSYLGFKEIAQVDQQLVFMEKALFGIDAFVASLKSAYVLGQRIGGIVMNANPFTLGHLYLIEYAASHADAVHLFILSEDASVFPQTVRYQLVKEGCAHLKNVYLHDTNDYMVSAKTFPSYFLPEDAQITSIQAKLDATIFKEYIAPALGITVRFVGEEPLSFATNLYNEAMKEVFRNTIELVIIPRKTFNQEVISASRVRALFKEDKLAEIKQIVPSSTYEFLISNEGRKIQNSIK